MKTIVLGVDDSAESGRAVERTIELARMSGASVIVTSAAPVMQFMARGTGSYDPADPPERHRGLAADAAARLAEQGIEARTITGLGDAGAVIVELAGEHEADLVVVGMSSHPQVSRFLGGVSEDVAHHADCDVLLVH
jgi:nucleotide-binding universal stress UspA family protein